VLRFGELNYPCLIIYFLNFICLTERERELAHKQGEWQVKGEGEADSAEQSRMRGFIPGPLDHDLTLN